MNNFLFYFGENIKLYFLGKGTESFSRGVETRA